MAARWILGPFVAFAPPFALGGAAAAQSAAVLGKSDAEFARKLLDASYPDLAEKLCALIEKSDTVTALERVSVKSLHLDLQLELVRREPDLFKRKDVLKDILQQKEELVSQYGGSKEAEQTAATLPDVYAQLGQTITSLVQKETDVGLVSQLQTEGQKIYAKAEEELEKRIQKLDEERLSDPKVEDRYMNAKYNLPRLYYLHSLLFPKGEWKKADLLEKAIKGFDEFSLDFSDSYLTYNGYLFRGLCDKELEKPEDALESFAQVIGLRERFDLNEKDGVYEMPPQACDIVSDGVLQKMLLQKEMQDLPGAIATAQDFLKTTPEPLAARNGLAVLAALSEAHLAAGDPKSANETATRLVEEDERGPWGAKGREIQARLIGSGGGSIDPAETLKIAATIAGRGNVEQALQICRQAIVNSKGTPKEAEIGTDASLLIGSFFLQREWYQEAALAFDTAADRWPNTEKAPEAVYRALQVYSRLNSLEKKQASKKRVEDRMKTLATRYATSPFAASSQLVEGQELEGEEEFAQAAELYAKVQPSSASYLEAQYRLGNAYFLQARKLLRGGKPDEAKQFVGQAETILKKSIADLDREAGKTLELAAQARLQSYGFSARLALVQLYLQAGVDRPADVLTALEGVDETYANDPDKVAIAWGFRIDALQAQNKLEEAARLLDALVKKTPDSPAIAPAAGKVARALDTRSNDLREKDKKPKEADEMLRKAAQYYSLSANALLKRQISRASEVETIADRLFVLGLVFNEVPEGQGLAFVGWDPKAARDTRLWTESAALYEAALRVSPSYKNEINLARALGFLGDYARAAATLGALFDRESVWDNEAKRFNTGLQRSKPELTTAYLEWGVAEHLAAVANGEPVDREGLSRAVNVLQRLTAPPPRGALQALSRLWWYAVYHRIQALYDLGDYGGAQLALNDVQRTTPELGGTEAELKKAFQKLEGEIKFKSGAATAPSPTNGESKPN